MRYGDWIANGTARETGPGAGRPVIFSFEDRPLSGQTYYPVDIVLGGEGSAGGDPRIVSGRGSDENGFAESLEIEWETGGEPRRQTYRPSGASSAG